MTRPPPHERPSARELASGGAKPLQIAGKPADACPYCGCAMFAQGTRQGEEMTFRYVKCRNRQCGRKFYSKQPPATIVREIGDDDELPSSSGRPSLTIRRQVG